MKYVQKHFWKEHLCALQVLLYVLFSRLVCARAQMHSLEGTLVSGMPRVRLSDDLVE